MSDFDDLYEVTEPSISDDLAEQLLSGQFLGPDAALDAAELEAVFSRLRAPAETSEVSGLDAAIAAFQGAVVATSAGAPTTRSRPMFKKLLTTKAIATVGAVALVSAGAAAASGTVPSPFASDTAQEVTAERVPDIARQNVAKHVTDPDVDDEIDEPEVPVVEAPVVEAPPPPPADDDPAAPVEENPSSDIPSEAVGPDASGPAKFGLCTAHANHDAGAGDEGTDEAVPSDEAVAFRNLVEAAEGAGQTVEEFCADATPGQPDEERGPDAESPSATAPGRAAENPSVTAPGRTVEDPAVPAPGPPAENPSVTAPGRSASGPAAPAPSSGANPSERAPGRG
jgi:hypothetical protein